MTDGSADKPRGNAKGETADRLGKSVHTDLPAFCFLEGNGLFERERGKIIGIRIDLKVKF